MATVNVSVPVPTQKRKCGNVPLPFVFLFFTPSFSASFLTENKKKNRKGVEKEGENR